MAATPEQVGPYRIVSQIGRGGMAVVYLARQPVLGRSVALKELAPFLAGDPALAQRFIREARVAGSLNHPNVVTVFDFLEQDGVPYIAMEYLERGSLRPFVGRMSLPQVAGVLEGLLAALSQAEAMKIVHRDVKPENLLVTSEGAIKIADFGIAKAVQQVQTEEMLTPAGATVGTPAYMAPEQAMAQEIGPWTDLYQTGVVAFELLAGAVPFQAEDAPVAMLMKHIGDPVPELPAGTDPALAAWVKRLMAKEPSGRPRGARAAWNELEEIIVKVAGPLWRREARLGEHEPTVEHTAPLTPARFSTWQDYVPEPSPRSPVNTPPTPAPPPPVPRRETAVPEPVPPVDEVPPAHVLESRSSASGDSYVDYVPGRPNVDEPHTPAPRESADPVASAPLDVPAPPELEKPPPAEPETPEPSATAHADPPTGFHDYEPDQPDVVQPQTPGMPAAAPPEISAPHAAVERGPAMPRGAPAALAGSSATTVAPTSRPLAPDPPRRRLPVVPIAASGLVAAAATVAFLVLGNAGDGRDPTPTPTATTATATATATVTSTPPAGPFAIGDGPDGIALGAGAVWAVASRDGTLTRIDPRSGETTSVKVGKNPDSVVVAFDSAWVSVTGENKVVRVSTDPQPEVIETFDVGARPEGIAASSRAIWIANSGDGSLSQIVEATGDVRTVQNVGGEPVGLAIGAGAVWVADADGTSVARVDGGRGQLAATVRGIGPNPRAVAIVGRDVWVATADDGRVWRIEGDANRVAGSVRVGGQPRDVTTDGQHLFVTDREGDRVVEIDPDAAEIVNREAVEDGPLSAVADDRDVWVTRFDGGDVARIAR